MSSNIQSANLKSSTQNFNFKSATVSNKLIDLNFIPVEQSNFNYEDINYDEVEEDLFTFDDLTDKQYNLLATATYIYIENLENFKAGMKLSEVQVKDGNGEFAVPKILKEFDKFTIVESYVGEDGYACLILQDEAGNYIMINPCTAEPKFGDTIEIDDLLYDFYPLLVELGVYDTALTDLEIDDLLSLLLSSFGKSIKDLGENPLEYIENIYISQRKQSENLTKKYYDNALKKGKQLSFFGYSKGGGIAEYSYLSCADYALSNQVLGDIILYNPFHDNLNEDEVKILSESGDLTLYRNQGDFVSSVYNEHDFENETTYIKCDWEKKYSEMMNPNSGELYSNINLWLEEYPLLKKIFGSVDIDMFKNIENVEIAIHGGAHSPGEASGDAYDPEGNAIEEYYDSEGNVIKVDSYDNSEVSKYIFDVDDIIEEGKSFIQSVPHLISFVVWIANTGETIYDIYEWGAEKVEDIKEFGNDIYEWGAEKVDNFCDAINTVWDVITFWD